MALLLWLGACIFWRSRPAALSWWGQLALQFAVGCAVLLAGLGLLGRDGRMATYTALVLVAASVQWLLLRGWKR